MSATPDSHSDLEFAPPILGVRFIHRCILPTFLHLGDIANGADHDGIGGLSSHPLFKEPSKVGFGLGEGVDTWKVPRESWKGLPPLVMDTV